MYCEHFTLTWNPRIWNLSISYIITKTLWSFCKFVNRVVATNVNLSVANLETLSKEFRLEQMRWIASSTCENKSFITSILSLITLMLCTSDYWIWIVENVVKSCNPTNSDQKTTLSNDSTNIHLSRWQCS